MTRERATKGSIRRHLFAIIGAAILFAGGIGVLGATTGLSGAVIASGMLVVESSVKKVQHPTGGTVGKLIVKEGMRVEAGDLLVRLDATTAQANLAMVTNSLAELHARRARLEAERDGADEIDFPSELHQAGTENIDRVLAGEQKLFELRRQAQQGQKDQLRERVAQLREEVQGFSDQAAAKRKEITFIGRELDAVRDLWQKNLVPMSRVTALERDAARLEGERGQLIATVAQSKGKISETELQIIQVDQTMRSDVARELADIRAKAAELAERKITAMDLLQRIDIRAPQAGFVHQLSVHIAGAVIASGESIMLIVPGADELIVEVRVEPRTIDQIKLEQPTTLRFPSFNQRTTPELNGRVSRIAADITHDPRTGTPYFLVRIVLSPGEAERLDGQTLVPGMPVEAFIRTEERTILSYLFKPLTDQARHAFRER